MVSGLGRRGAAAFLLAAGSCLAAHAQATSGSGMRQLEVAVTFDAVRANHISTGTTFYLEGGSFELAAPFYHGFALAAIVSGATHGSQAPETAGLNLLTIVFGPRYRFTPRKGRFSFFAQGLAGEADGFHSVFYLGSGPVNNPLNGTTDSASSLAVEAGGGVDLKLHKNFGVRLVEADYLRTQLPNGANNVQNNLRLAAGVTFGWGH